MEETGCRKNQNLTTCRDYLSNDLLFTMVLTNETETILTSPWTLLLLLVLISLLLTIKRPSGVRDVSKQQGQRGRHRLWWLECAETVVTISLILLSSWKGSMTLKQYDTGQCPNSNNSSERSSDLFSSYYHIIIASPLAAYSLVIFLRTIGTFNLFNTSVPILFVWMMRLLSHVWCFYEHTFPNKSEEVPCSDDDVFINKQQWIGVLEICGVLFQCCLGLIPFTFTFTTPGPRQKLDHHDVTVTSRNVPPPVHPQSTASWWSDCFLVWTLGLTRLGYQRTLVESDVYDLVKEDKCRHSTSKLECLWKIEEFKRDLESKMMMTCDTLEQDEDADSEKTEMLEGFTRAEDGYAHKQGKMDQKMCVSLFKVLVQAFGLKFFLFQILKGAGELVHVLRPVLMAYFLNHIQNRDNESWLKGVCLVVGIFVFDCALETFHDRLWCAIGRHQIHIRSSLMLSVFRKSLRVKNEHMKDLTTGQIVNLISDDCDRVHEMSQVVFYIFSTPLLVISSMYLVYRQVGNALVVGVFIMVLLLPVNKYIGTTIKEMILKLRKEREKRIKLMNEIVNGIKVLKLYAWEPSFIKKVHDIRRREERYFHVISALRACSDGMLQAIPILVQCGAFGTFLVHGGHVNAVKGFVTLQFIRLLNDPFTHMAFLMPRYLEAAYSLGRINKFLNGEDIPEEVVVVRTRKGQSAINIDNGEFVWDTNSTRPTLTSINVDIPKGSLVAVVGTVGCGKSSLISAMLGEMEKLHGEVEVQGRVAYVPQEAWILNASLQDNILFGSKMDDRRYERVIHASALKHDIRILTAGDQTQIGEKGINLSGGQKQRVSLARALYNDADVYLMDDPLSAVDAHVGKHIFDKVMGHRGMLAGKTRVLVTHGVHLLPFVDSIIVLKDGIISESGTYTELTTHEGDFAQFVRDVLSKKMTENSPEVVDKVERKILMRISSIPEKTENDEIESEPQCDGSDLLSEDDLTESDSSGEAGTDTTDSEAGGKVDWESGGRKGGGKVDWESGGRKGGGKVDWESGGRKGGGKVDWESGGRKRSGKDRIDEEDDLQGGQVMANCYLKYFSEVGYKRLFAVQFFLFVSIISGTLKSRVIKDWTEDVLLSNDTFVGSEKYVDTNWQYFIFFLVSAVVEVVTKCTYSVVALRGAFVAANRMHNTLLYKMMRCPMSFFDMTPSSQIITRFSKDVPRLDDLGQSIKRTNEQFFKAGTHIIAILIFCPVLVLYLIPVSVASFMVYRLHIGAIQHLKRLTSNYKAPMFFHFTEALRGRASIRAYKSQETFTKTMEDKIDTFMKFQQCRLWVSVGMNLRLTLLFDLITLTTCLMCVMDTTMTPGMAGLLTTYSTGFSQTVISFFRNLSDSDTEIVSMERVVNYSNKPSEAEWKKDDNTPASDWPTDGRVVFEDYKARYRDGLDLVLRGINCRIEKGQKVGIVGRTGAGKTSLTMAFFRLFESAGGRIKVDDEFISQLGLHDLRSRVNILPQDPIIFSGTLRMNLDPFGKSTEEEIWTSLRHSHIASFVDSLEGKLDFECEEGGKNLSMGQRQLLCLARTLLKKTSILVLDEATAAVDMETDELIQKTIRTEFKDCTVLTIAHRLNTVLDYDKILVLEQGLVKEFDSPSNLLADKQSTFYGMAKDAKLVHG